MISVELTEDHLRAIKVRDFERHDLGDNFSKNQIESYLSSDYKKAVLNSFGEIVFLFGGKMMNEGGWVWLLASELLYENPIASLEKILEMHNEGMEMFKPSFAYTFNHPDFPIAIKFLKKLGYEDRGRVDFEDGVKRILMIKEYPQWAQK